MTYRVVGGPCHGQRTSKLLSVSRYYDRVSIYAHGNGNGNGDACVFALHIQLRSLSKIITVVG